MNPSLSGFFATRVDLPVSGTGRAWRRMVGRVRGRRSRRLQDIRLPAPFRVHAPPPTLKLEALTDFLISQAAQLIIRDYKVKNEHLFVPTRLDDSGN